ncbi:hypothetical protein H2201_005464 [Coniosporium apollinis]|uniref:Vesicle-mediated transporter Vid24 n=2 Tax=Coniosporium TaxID=2810619 RepID=A0ABQ9NQF8_9PEZI|nr:hypothetical protein H2199_001547 [Cladosporium sp. JES 115]KAJ9663743.1 hypothetical protein H2201_005464 [Coniosporium apollinis]
MPNPRDDILMLSPAAEPSTADCPSCPSEGPHQQDRESDSADSPAPLEAPVDDAYPPPLQQPTPPAEDDRSPRVAHIKRLETDGDRPMRDTPSPSASEESSDSYIRGWQAQTASSSTSVYHPGLLESPIPRRHRFQPNSTSSFLRPGSKFHGTQQSDRQVYDVQVEIKYVDMAESFLCGYLRIQGLTDDHPTLTTYFEGEIIGTKYTFQTKHPEWGSNEKVDMQHWGRFPAWRPLAKQAKRPDFSYKNFAQRENIFMRWKEYFLVPDHRVRTISGASFEGFYYICFNQVSGSVSGIYFHAKSEK